jgi:hypothetical protein
LGIWGRVDGTFVVLAVPLIVSRWLVMPRVLVVARKFTKFMGSEVQGRLTGGKADHDPT